MPFSLMPISAKLSTTSPDSAMLSQNSRLLASSR